MDDLAALKYLLENIKSENLDVKAFEKECGVGIVVNAEDIENAVKEVIDKNKDEILEKRYYFAFMFVVMLPWVADYMVAVFLWQISL